MESSESFEEISARRKFSLGLEAGDIGAIVTAGTAWGPAKRDNRIDWGSGAEPGTVSPHLGLVLPTEPAGAGSPRKDLRGARKWTKWAAAAGSFQPEEAHCFQHAHVLLPCIDIQNHIY